MGMQCQNEKNYTGAETGHISEYFLGFGAVASSDLNLFQQDI